MIAEKFGFAKDENNVQLKEVFKNNLKLKEIHIDIYPENPLASSSAPFMLLLRMIEKKVIIENNSNRLILKKNIDRFNTHLMNVPLSEIKDCLYRCSNGCCEFILNIQNIYYKITVFN